METSRLAPHDDEWIDRSAPLDFKFEGAAYRGCQGDVVASALWAAGVRVVGRSFKYHRPRGIYSLAGADVNAMFEDGRRTNLRGDVAPLVAGMNLRSVNTAGGLQRDAYRWFERASALMPVGFYYKAFHTPRSLFPFYERQMRKIAGLGRINPQLPAEKTAKDYAHHDLLVVGGGLSGMSAALAAAECGARVMLADEQPRLGGSAAWQARNVPDVSGWRETLIEQVTNHPRIEVRCSTQVAGCYADHWYALTDADRLTKLRTRGLIVASGCYEQPAVFHNNDLPGVLLGSAAQRLAHLYAVKPFSTCVVLAGNDDAYQVAIDLKRVGVHVAAVVDLRPKHRPTPAEAACDNAGIERRPGAAIWEAVAASGTGTVQGVRVAPVQNVGAVGRRDTTYIPCDGVAVSVGWMPVAGPLYQAGGRFTYSDQLEQLVPKSLPATIYAAGRVNGVFEFADRMADGKRAGVAAAVELGFCETDVPASPSRAATPHSHPYPVYAHPKKKNFVDFDEDLQLHDFVNAHQEGYDNIELLKRYSTFGMGPSQGKLANMNAIRILARLNQATINETGATTSRPFHHPVPLRHLAGRRFHPHRCTPMHAWHQRAGARFVHAGAWRRPEYYPVEGQTREESILAEATRVRRDVGLIDLGTLGKMFVEGPDAATFLDRIYTDRFSKLKEGSMRYGLACDEAGLVADDGIVARFGQNRFYITASTGGAASLFREMKRWAILWRSNVNLIDATGNWTAMNLAGPHARQILADLVDIDISSEALPMGGVREAKVAGVMAKIMRVGFVGEVSYELHLPASYGLSLWETLMDRGAEHQIGPFGVEAQRLLRLEKGHPIVSIDTDALTNPYEANLGWAVAKNKEFFIGQRSLKILKQQPPTRRLAGFEIPGHYNGPLPEECHLIIRDQQIAGRVTSVAHRSTLGKTIGLAFLLPELAQPGVEIAIRIDGGQLVPATVAELPFYDPDHARQI